MKKKIIICFAALILLIVICLLIFINKPVEKFYLEDKYYGNNNLTEIDIKTLNKLIDDKESFGLFIYEPSCVTSNEFNEVLFSFQEENNIAFYKFPFSQINGTSLEKEIKYYPSFIIYKDGKIIDFLEADKDEDTKRYKNKNDFKNWFFSYVKSKSLN